MPSIIFLGGFLRRMMYLFAGLQNFHTLLNLMFFIMGTSRTGLKSRLALRL